VRHSSRGGAEEGEGSLPAGQGGKEGAKRLTMKSSARKGGGGGGGASSFAVPCVASLAFLTLFVAFWQVQFYVSLLTSARNSASPACALLATTAAAGTATGTDQPEDPNKRVLRPYGSAAALFVQFGAYRGGPRTFAVVGLASKPTHMFGTPYFKCEWVPNPNPAGGGPVRTKAYKMLPDWGYGRVYTVVVVNCTFPSNPNSGNSGGRLLVHAYYSTSSRRHESFVALEEAPGAYDEARYAPPFPYDYLYCGSSLYGNLSADRMREWVSYHARFFGPRSHIVLHDAGGVSPEVKAVLDPWVRAGRVTVQDIRAQAEYDGYYYNQFLVVNDCLHRYRHAANWTFFFDVDEYIYLPDGRTLEEVLGKLEGYSQFTIKQNPMSSKLCVQDPSGNYARFVSHRSFPSYVRAYLWLDSCTPSTTNFALKIAPVDRSSPYIYACCHDLQV
jgi:galactan beta-1,4-galactosyltransferase